MSRFIDQINVNLKDMQNDLAGNATLHDWPFMSSPFPVVSILLIYLVFVLKIGPKLMENRKPFELKKLLIVYNAYQVIFSFWMCTEGFRNDAFIQFMNTYGCEKNDNVTDVFHQTAWWFFFSKIVDLCDTVFFVLRKKQNQITFLHVYHHTITAFNSWFYLKYIPGEQGILIGFLNSFVHVIMYFYYMLAAMGPRFQKYLWWKKYLTGLQLVQFGIMLIYLTIITLMQCQMPFFVTCFFFSNILVFVILFSNFYRKAYGKQDIMIYRSNQWQNLKDIQSNLEDSE